MNNKQSKKIISIRTRLFLQVGAVVVVAVLLILSLNNFLLPTIYAKNEKRSMIDVKNEISTFDFNAGDYVSQLSSLEKKYGFSIDIYSQNGDPLYFGTTDIFSSKGKITVSKRQDYDDGSFFEIQTIENENIQYFINSIIHNTSIPIRINSTKLLRRSLLLSSRPMVKINSI